MYAPTIATVTVAKSPDSSLPIQSSPQLAKKVTNVVSSFLLLSFSLVINKVILHDEQRTYRYGNDSTVREANQLSPVSPNVRGQDSLNYLDCASREVVAQEVNRCEMRGLEVVGHGLSRRF